MENEQYNLGFNTIHCRNHVIDTIHCRLIYLSTKPSIKEQELSFKSCTDLQSITFDDYLKTNFQNYMDSIHVMHRDARIVNGAVIDYFKYADRNEYYDLVNYIYFYCCILRKLYKCATQQ